MIQIKKTLLTLVALLAVTTGAWAQDPNAVTAAEINSVVYSGWSSIDGKLFKASELPGFQAVTENQAKSWAGVPSTGEVILYYEFVADGNVKAVKFKNGVYDSSFEETELTCNLIWEDIVYSGDKKYFYTTGPAPASGPEVAWTAASKTGTFTMPGGNVTLDPEYYHQATVADGGVTAADADARATTDDPLVKVDATKLTGAKKLMYFVSNSGTTAPAYDAEGWTDQLPTAEGFTQQGIVYVWYYPVGTDEGVDGATATYSDGDICLQSITARIAAEPTYAVTFAEGTEESDKWTASPAAGVKKGQTVTVTYTGSKKVIGVKAEKKAGDTGKSLAEATVGMIVGSNGKAYAADDKDNLPSGVTAVAKVCYVDGNGHGLALALTDEGSSMNWSTAQTTCAAHTPAITGGTWKLASKGEWDNMINAAGSYDDLRNGFSSVGGTNMQSNVYWSSTEYEDDSSKAYYYDFYGGYYNVFSKSNTSRVRACLAF